MDHYISEFYKLVDNCKVKDYCVFLEKKTGFARFNPFNVHEQLVIFLTDRGIYCVRVCGMGELCDPRRPSHIGLQLKGKLAVCESICKQYCFIRKWKGGSTDSYEAFFTAVQNGKD